MKKFVQLTCIVIGWKVLDDAPLFFGMARCQERGSIVCKHRWTEDAKTKVYIFVYKVFANSIFKSYTAIAIGFHALAQWRHYKVKLLQNSIISVLVILPSEIVPTSQTRSVLSNTSQYRFKKQLLLRYYETYLQVEKALLNNLQRKAAKIKQRKNKDTNRWLAFISGHIRKGEF